VQPHHRKEKEGISGDVSTVVWVQIPAIHVRFYDVGQCEVSNLNESLNLFDPTFLSNIRAILKQVLCKTKQEIIRKIFKEFCSF
jgi:hypothetical protein